MSKCYLKCQSVIRNIKVAPEKQCQRGPERVGLKKITNQLPMDDLEKPGAPPCTELRPRSI